MLWHVRQHHSGECQHQHQQQQRWKKPPFSTAYYFCFVDFFRVLCAINETNRLNERNPTMPNCCEKMCVIVTHKYHVTQLLFRSYFFLLSFIFKYIHFISRFNVPFIYISAETYTSQCRLLWWQCVRWCEHRTGAHESGRETKLERKKRQREKKEPLVRSELEMWQRMSTCWEWAKDTHNTMYNDICA